MIMNEKQTRFVHEFLVDRNGSGAAVRAGYSRRTAGQIAHELLKKPDIAAAVQEGEALIAAEAKLTRQDVLAGLQEAIEMARLRADASAMIAGWREIAKMCGFYAPERHEVRLSADARALQSELERLSDAELLTIIEGEHADVLGTQQLALRTTN